MNKHDAVVPEQRVAALSFVRQHLKMIFGRPTPPIFSISAKDALKAKLSGDRDLLDASGILGFEEQLLGFLLTKRSSEYLLRMYDRARHFLLDLPQTAEISGLIARVDALNKEIDGTKRGVATEPVSMPTVSFRALRRLPSCEICAHVAERLWRFLCEYQYEITISRDEQQRFADRGGLCPFHTWQLQAMSSPYGISAGHAPVLERLAAALRYSASALCRQEIDAQLQKMLPGEHDCVLCNVRSSAEHEAIDAAAKRLERDPTPALNKLSAICIPHFVMLVSAVYDDELARTMLRRQATVLERHTEDMRRFAIKHAGVRRHLASEEETTAAERGLLLVVGRQQVNFMPPARTAPGVEGKDQRSSLGLSAE